MCQDSNFCSLKLLISDTIGIAALRKADAATQQSKQKHARRLLNFPRNQVDKNVNFFFKDSCDSHRKVRNQQDWLLTHTILVEENLYKGNL